jgi:hypothetical protein
MFGVLPQVHLFAAANGSGIATTGGGVSFQTPELIWAALGCMTLSTPTTLTVKTKPIKTRAKDF